MKATTNDNVLTIKSVTQFGEDVTTTLEVVRDEEGREDYVHIVRHYMTKDIKGRVVNVIGTLKDEFWCVEEFNFYVSSFKEIIKWATDISKF